MKQMIDIGVFDNDERIIVNKICEDVNVAAFTKARLLTSLSVSCNIVAEQDILDLLDGLIAKVERIADDEWDYLKMKIPFETYCDAESNVDEVPADEDM